MSEEAKVRVWRVSPHPWHGGYDELVTDNREDAGRAAAEAAEMAWDDGRTEPVTVTYGEMPADEFAELDETY